MLLKLSLSFNLLVLKPKIIEELERLRDLELAERREKRKKAAEEEAAKKEKDQKPKEENSNTVSTQATITGGIAAAQPQTAVTQEADTPSQTRADMEVNKIPKLCLLLGDFSLVLLDWLNV